MTRLPTLAVPLEISPGDLVARAAKAMKAVTPARIAALEAEYEADHS